MQNKNENTKPQGSSGEEEKDTGYSKSAAPSLSLPKGGGAMKGIDEKFEVNAVNGTAGMSIPLPFSKGRSDFSPSLTLNYNSGTGNSEFGMGWSLSLPSIQRRTDKKLPQYDDANESDVFLFAGAEDLVPELDSGGIKRATMHDFEITRYFPRVEGAFARIEKIRPVNQTVFYWKVTTKDNITTFFGLNVESRIADPKDADRIFKWLPDVSYDDKGNYHVFEYAQENLVEVPNSVHEKHRHDGTQDVENSYLKIVRYGNLLPFYNDDRRSGYNDEDAFAPILPSNPEFFFSSVFDYGEHDSVDPQPDDNGDWLCRKDPFSNYKAGFEIRTYRLCKRILCFHHFEELGLDAQSNILPYLVRSVDLTYKFEETLFDLLETDYIVSVTQTAYRRKDSPDVGYDKRPLPAMEFEYQEPEWDTTIHNITDENLVNAPVGLSKGYQWMDFWNEGISGILTEQAEAWYYKENLGEGEFTPAQKIAPKPSFNGLNNGRLQIQDLEANGKKYVVSTDKALQGFFELNDEDEWEDFQFFKQLPNVDYNDPNTKFLDLNGDGMPDLLITHERVLTWYAAKGKIGYDEARTTTHVLDEEKGPSIVFADSTQRIFLADMSGDGLTDIVRIRNKDICYWPNIGYGRFGAKVTMSDAPLMDKPDQFNPAYIQLADVSGTGLTDIIYMGKDQFRAWLNLSGNGFTEEAQEITPFPNMEQPNNIQLVDLLGNGTSCIVWSSPLPRYANAPMRYIDLMGSKKPYLMKGYDNNAGKLVSVEYRSSTKFYLDDKAKGTPWITKLPFPVHCVQKTTIEDVKSGATYSQLYTYHHGYYDHAEREFRGFGRVETKDIEKFTLPEDDNITLDEPPVLTKTWYHTGCWLRDGKILDQYKEEYFKPEDYDQSLTVFTENDLVQPALDAAWTTIEHREAVRALKGVALRQEVYALDESTKEHLPYTTSEMNYHIQRLQERGDNMYGVFLITEKENIAYNYERNAADPRIAHNLNIEIDVYGNVLEQAAVVYRRAQEEIDDAGVPDTVEDEQQKTHIIYTMNEFTNDITVADGAYRLRVPYAVKQYELTGLSKSGDYFTIAELKDDFNNNAAALDYTDTASGSTEEKRLIEAQRSRFLADDASTPLAFGTMESLGIPHEQYRLAFTPDLLTNVYGSKVDATKLGEGAYVELDASSGEYWIASGTIDYGATPADDFFMPKSYDDPFGNTTTLTYCESPTGKKYFLLLEKTTDELNNESSVLLYDFRTLQPLKLQDPNENKSLMAYDILGMPVGMALLGKGDDDTDTDADHLTGFDADLSDTERDNFFNDPITEAPGLLAGATVRYVYDYESLPLRVATISREQHVVSPAGGGAGGGNSPLQLAFEYSDGLGRVLMKKVQAEPGLYKDWVWDAVDEEFKLEDVDSGTDLRWVGTGRTILNNKSKPVQQYEPYFSGTHDFEEDDELVEIGYTPTIYYDPVGRVIRTDMPNGTFSKVEFDAWQQKNYDENDNSVGSDWETTMLAGSDEEEDAAEKAAMHNDTPTTIHLDSLARPFYTQYDYIKYKWDDTQSEYILEDDFVIDNYEELDIEGNRKKVVDGNDAEVQQHWHDMLGNVIKQVSQEGGTSYALNTCFGFSMYAWDADDREFNISYDELHRPISKTVTASSTTTTIEVMEYGEDEPDDTAKNLRGQLVRHYDGSGLLEVLSYNLQYLITEKKRTFTESYDALPDWTTISSVGMESSDFTESHVYDALGRLDTYTAPDGSETTYEYNEAGLLESIVVDNVHSLSSDIITNIDYNAKRQRTKVSYANGTVTTYAYDEKTYRLENIKTVRTSDSKVLQDLYYWYDAVGNITKQRDEAQQTIFFNNSIVEPENDYLYDSINQLVNAWGREHEGQTTSIPTSEDNWHNYGQSNLAHKADSGAMRTYRQKYSYDKAGNMTELKHIADTGSYTRSFTYDATKTNQLEKTTIGSTDFEYTYDNRGNMITMPHLSDMDYNELNQFSHCQKGDNHTYYQYDASGTRSRKITIKGSIVEIRYYLGSYEIFKKIDSSTLTLQRHTLHVMDNGKRIAMIETPATIPSGSNEVQLMRYQYSNHLDTATLELDDQGLIISYEEYHPYGTTSLQTMDSTREVPAKRYRNGAKERDEESGLYYHVARYYAPWICRWTAVDPIEYDYTFWDSVKYSLGFSGEYHFGMNNHENNNEIKGIGYGKNLYDSRQGKWSKIDSVSIRMSSYVSMDNSPIFIIDPSGKGGVAQIVPMGKGKSKIVIEAKIFIYTNDANVDIEHYRKKIQSDIDFGFENPVVLDADGNVTGEAPLVVNNGPQGHVAAIEFKVEVKVVTPEEAKRLAKEAYTNSDYSANFMEVSSSANSSGVSAEGFNTGVYSTKDLDSRGKTTAVHEFLHLLGYKRPFELGNLDDQDHAEDSKVNDIMWRNIPGALGGLVVGADYDKQMSERRVTPDALNRINEGKGFGFGNGNFWFNHGMGRETLGIGARPAPQNNLENPKH